MEFEKKPNTRADEHAKSEVPKKVKKKRVSKEKATVAETKRAIKAPVSAEILAEENKKNLEEKAKASKKTKKKTGQAANAGTVTTAQKASKETAPHAAAESKPNKRAKKETHAAEQSEAPLQTFPESTGDSVTAKPAETFFEERDIPLHETDDEGELFVSERWQRSVGSEPAHETDEAPQVSAEDTPDTAGEVDTDSTEDEGKTPKTRPATSRPTTQPQQSAAVNPSRTRSQRSTVRATGSTPTPPSSTVSFANQPPLYNPNVATANTAPSPIQTPAAANRAPYNYRTAERRSLIAGIILGGVIEHIRHKRREKRREKTHEREIKKLKDEQQFQQTEQYKEKQKAERTKTTLERQIDRLKQNVIMKTESKSLAGRPETTPASSFYEDFKQKYRTNPETSMATAPPTGAQERVQRKAARTEKPAPVPKQQPENIDEPLQVSPDRRVETSAWHRIEVDKKTGKAIENPELTYGEEFQNEQHQEQLRRQIDEASIDSEQVKQNYLPIVDKTANTVVETHDTPRSSQIPPPPKQVNTTGNINDTLQNIRDRASDSNLTDMALFGVLVLVVIAIIIAL